MSLASGWPIAAGLGLGYAADALVGDPRRWHPVAGFGAVAARLEQPATPTTALAGVVHVGLLVGSAAGLGVGLERLGRRHPIVMTMVTAVGHLDRARRALAAPGGGDHRRPAGRG